MSFGTWVNTTEIDLPQIELLRQSAVALGAAWPADSDFKHEFRTALSGLPVADRAAAIEALNAAWSIYSNTSDKTTGGSVIRSLFSTKMAGLTVLISIGVGIIFIFFRAYNNITLEDLAATEKSRGLLTLLFGLTTVGVALIIVLAVFLGEDLEESLQRRFQRGKDILTVLIGVFGAILGFYFGSEKSGAMPPPSPQVSDTDKTPKPGVQPDQSAPPKPDATKGPATPKPQEGAVKVQPSAAAPEPPTDPKRKPEPSPAASAPDPGKKQP